jgi:hypothetical protein
MAYYFDHKDEIDQELRKELEEVERFWAERPPSAMALRIRALRQQQEPPDDFISV